MEHRNNYIQLIPKNYECEKCYHEIETRQILQEFGIQEIILECKITKIAITCIQYTLK